MDKEEVIAREREDRLTKALMCYGGLCYLLTNVKNDDIKMISVLQTHKRWIENVINDFETKEILNLSESKVFEII